MKIGSFVRTHFGSGRNDWGGVGGGVAPLSTNDWGGGDDGPSAGSDLVAGIERSGMRREVVGASAGAVAGGLLGFYAGMRNLQADRVTVQDVRTPVTTPVLVGARYTPESCSTNFTYDGDGNINGSYTTCDGPYSNPILRHDATGKVLNSQQLNHSAGWRNPFINAGIGMASGAVLGFAGALLYSVIRDRVDDVEHGPSRAPWIGLGVGAAAGGGLGLWAGNVAADKQFVLEGIRQEAVTVNRQLGTIPTPGEFPRGQGNQIGLPVSGSKPVVQPVPTGEIRDVPFTQKAYWLTPLSGAIIGAGMGAGMGFAAGVAGSLVERSLRDK